MPSLDGVAHRAICAESGSNVIGRPGSLEVLQMAVHAVGRQSEKHFGLVTLRAVHAPVSACQREVRIVLEIRWSPPGGNVALLAVGQPALG